MNTIIFMYLKWNIFIAPSTYVYRYFESLVWTGGAPLGRAYSAPSAGFSRYAKTAANIDAKLSVPYSASI